MMKNIITINEKRFFVYKIVDKKKKCAIFISGILYINYTHI